ncbi:hypothetical protein Poli38472_010837 [Pythium oligandrum]|uniref:Sugar transporter SWEET1 n=1 Tax=Pythium oligandrum TaxID=41045 RepID=A0A8K1CEX4_PYTOL|nr:hypothetical protein Poli38472_010837 [Pythium oligandrum]|eukprot:TMW61774.1 hypothetical protein Poli38472_010837 [Pythium oligandrum]
MVPDVLVQVVKAGASLAACYLSSSLFPEIREVHRNKATGTMLLLPIPSMFGNGVLWTLYGFLAHDYFPLVATNAVGIAFSAFYMAVYLRYTTEKCSVLTRMLLVWAALLGLILYAVLSPEAKSAVKERIGYIAIAVCAVMFGSPLVVVKQVVQTKNSALLPFGMIVAGVLNSVLWLSYGLLIQDMIVVAPNFLNLMLGATQLVLICVYRQPKTPSKTEKPQETPAIPVEKPGSDDNSTSSETDIEESKMSRDSMA